jgi:hypothetical protein
MFTLQLQSYTLKLCYLFTENRVLKRIFGPKREEVAGRWRRLHNEGLHNLYVSPNNIRVITWSMRWVGHVASMGQRKECNNLVGKPEGEIPLGRPRRG